MKFRQTAAPPTLIQLSTTERATKEQHSQDDLKKRYEVMKLYISRNNTSNSLIKNLQDINDKYSPSYAKLDHQLSSTSFSSSNLKEERQTTASGLSKSVSYRSFIREGIGSSRNDRQPSKGKADSNSNQREESNLRSSPTRSRNARNQAMRGATSEKSLVTRDNVNSLIGRSGNKESQMSSIESPSRDLRSFMIKPQNDTVKSKQRRELNLLFQQQQIPAVVNFLSPRYDQLGNKTVSQFPAVGVQKSMRVNRQLQQQSQRNPLGNIFSKAEKSALSYQNDSTLSASMKSNHNNSLFLQNQCVSVQSGGDFRCKEVMTTQGDDGDNENNYDRQDTSGDDLYHTASSSQQNKNHFYNAAYNNNNNNRVNVKTTIPRLRESIAVQQTSKRFNTLISGDKDRADMSSEMHKIASPKTIMFLTNKAQNNALLNNRNAALVDHSKTVSKPFNFPLTSQSKKRMKNLKPKTEPEAEGEDENNMFVCLYDPIETTEATAGITNEQNGYASQDTFNIFGQAHDYARSLQLKLQYNLTRLQPSKDVIRFIDAESKNIYHKITTMNIEKNNEMLRSSFITLAEATISTIGKIYPYFEDGMAVIGDRNALDEVLSKINSETTKGKNTIVSILCTKSFAKISKLNKNFVKAIELYKQCKNLADKPIAFRYRMNCYKNIGFCFSQLKSHEFSMFYYGKMLRIAWYLGDRDLELQAYDLIGLQYFYQGKLDKAQYYHNKMINGNFEGDSSDLRRLGISKIENELKSKDDGNGYGTTGAVAVSVDAVTRKFLKAKQARARQDADNLNKSQDFCISSESEDDFELPFPTQSHQQKHKDEQQNSRKNNETAASKALSPREQSQNEIFSDEEANQNDKFGVTKSKRKKNEPLFYHKDQHKLKQITDEANKNIRIGALEKKKDFNFVMPQKQITAQSFKQIKGSTKTPYRLNHLSVNRELENYQCLDARVTKVKHFNFNEQMYDQYDQLIKPKIKNIFEDLRDNLLFAMANLEMMVQKQKYPSKRKVGICQLPLQNIEQQRQNQKLVFSTLYHDFSKS